MSCVFARIVIYKFCWSVDEGRPCLLNQNFSWCMHRSIVGWITVIVFLFVCLGLLSSSYSLCWILLLVWFLAWSALITLHLPWWILHWLPYPQRITYKLCMIMFKCFRGSAPAYLADYCTSTSLVPGRSALRSAAHGDIVVPSHRTDWGLRSFAVADPSSWNASPVGLRSSSFGLDTFAKHLKTHLFGLAYSRHCREYAKPLKYDKPLNRWTAKTLKPFIQGRPGSGDHASTIFVMQTQKCVPCRDDRARTFEFVVHFVWCDTVTVSLNQTIIIIIIVYRLYIIWWHPGESFLGITLFYI